MRLCALDLLVVLIGTKVMPEPTTKADFNEGFRVIGFTAAPGVFNVLAIIPFLGPLISFVIWIWMVVVGVVAVRQVLDYSNTGRAIIVCLYRRRRVLDRDDGRSCAAVHWAARHARHVQGIDVLANRLRVDQRPTADCARSFLDRLDLGLLPPNPRLKTRTDDHTTAGMRHRAEIADEALVTRPADRGRTRRSTRKRLTAFRPFLPAAGRLPARADGPLRLPTTGMIGCAPAAT